MFDRLTIIGLGLIGGSIARGAHARKLAGRIVGCDPNEVSLAYGRKQGFIDIAMHDPLIAVKGANLVILAAPPSALSGIMQAIAPGLTPGCMIMDCCSVKQAAIAAIAPHLPPDAIYIPAHPIAGREQSGIAAGRADLFERKRVIITPEQALENDALRTATAFWQGLGARVEAMPPHLHDMIYAYVSHLPHLLSFTAARVLAGYADESDGIVSKFLRLSGSHPALWADIAILNKDNIGKALDRYLDAVAHICRELATSPVPADQPPDERLVYSVLFPRIAASCLVTTVMEAEKQAGFSFARYAGTGFADVTAPAAPPPDDDLAHISVQFPAVIAALADYMERLNAVREALTAGDTAGLEAALAG